MATNYVAEGDVIQYTNAGSAISAGDMVILGGSVSARVGVALTDIAASTGVGSVAVRGVFTLAKFADAVIPQSSVVWYDLSNTRLDDEALSTATGDFIVGTAYAAAAATETTVQVYLDGSARLLVP